MATNQQENNRRKIKAWMVTTGLSGSRISRDLGYNPTGGAVSHFISGRITCKKIRDFFLNNGCPIRLLNSLDKIRSDQIRKKRKHNNA